MPEQLLTGWGRTEPSRATVIDLAHSAPDPNGGHADADAAAIAAALDAAGPRGLLPRGLGRSYNDAAQNAGGTVVRLRADPIWDLDTDTGLLTCPAGVRLCELIDGVLPLGWFPPVTPGTSQVTIGGMLAADVHGKNHHRDGSIGRHVLSMDVVTGTGALVRLEPHGDLADWFWATMGGMGLTGVITQATLQLFRVPGPRIHSREARHQDLDDLMAGLQAADEHRYSVAWVDGTARGRRFGRGLVASGEHAAVDSTPGEQAAGPARRALATGADRRALPATARSASASRPLLNVPITLPLTPLNRWTIAAFNEAWFRKPGTGEHLTSVRSFFHPLDAVGGWNRIYGPRGFVQYQFVVPDAGAEVVGRALGALQGIGAASFLSVLKRFGPGNPAPLSFPFPGWTLALDLPAGVPGLARVLDDLDQEVAAAGGRVYLAKDGRVRPDVLPTMYPRLDDWRQTRAEMDPHRVLRSDLARRLGL